MTTKQFNIQRMSVTSAKSFEGAVAAVNAGVGNRDMGEFTRKVAAGSGAPTSFRLVAGNPVIMQAMVRHVPDAASYAPVTVLIDERADGVHLSYDSMASMPAPYGNAEALQVAQDLDNKIRASIEEAEGA